MEEDEINLEENQEENLDDYDPDDLYLIPDDELENFVFTEKTEESIKNQTINDQERVNYVEKSCRKMFYFFSKKNLNLLRSAMCCIFRGPKKCQYNG